MTGGRHRLPTGGRIDRDRPLGFSFNGQRMTGFAGDTLAAALLANGVHLVGRSFKYHRPRGIFSAGAEEPNALVQLEAGPRSQPNLRATQVELYEGLVASSVNCWPSVRFDVGVVNDLFARLLPAGFYYKTFMWPGQAGWHFYERIIRRAAGLGTAPTGPDPDRYEKTHAHCDVLVAGGGPAGLAAALAAGRAGARVILADEQIEPGGALLGTHDRIEGMAGADWVAGALGELAGMAEVTVLSRSAVAGYYDHNWLTVVERVTDHLGLAAPPGLPRQRLHKVRARHVVLATGALERPLMFRNNDRPGIMLASAAQTLVNRWAVAPGRDAVVFTNNDGAWQAALDLADAGIRIAAIVDLRDDPQGPLVDEARARGIDIRTGEAVLDSAGRRRIANVQVGAPGGRGTAIACDILCVSGGWNPAVHLFSQSAGKTAWDEARGAFLPGDPVQQQTSVGAAAGTFDLAACLRDGHQAGRAAAKAAGHTATAGRAPAADAAPEVTPVQPAGPVAVADGHMNRHFVDLANDVTVDDLRLAAREGYRSVEHTKRYTTLGMGTDQGKTSNVNGLAVLAAALGRPVPEVGHTTFRPPWTPVPFGVLAGRDIGGMMDPERRTPMHHWHEQVGALFEDVGQWKRPYCYPQAGEAKPDAVNRECLAVRHAIGMLDATTLGKIDIQGADTAAFINRIYTNAWLKLPVGRCRYGLMCDENGMIFDDGVTSRLGENRYLMTTTTGNAARVLDWLEEYHQTEWPEMQVWFTSVTEQFATITICGPKAGDLLAALSDDIPAGQADFPFMSWREGHVAGLPARVFRISFTGENSFEINVPANFGMAVWTALLTAGEKYGITPFGTEAMHVLRAEKGFIIVGQETDATVTPRDLGMDWAIKKSGDFVGRRAHARPDTCREGRKQLVGLRTVEPTEVLPEGGQIVAELRPRPPMTMIGHVTSSYYSAALGHSIALALVKGGRDRTGETVHVPLLDGRNVAATICAPQFYDPEGERLRG